VKPGNKGNKSVKGMNPHGSAQKSKPQIGARSQGGKGTRKVMK